jgi:hypothetical protein
MSRSKPPKCPNGRGCGVCGSDESYRFPERIILDEVAFEMLTERLENPRPPTEALKRLFGR